MSHIVQIQTQVRDAAAVQAACRRLALPAPEQGTVKLFSGDALDTGRFNYRPGFGCSMCEHRDTHCLRWRG